MKLYFSFWRKDIHKLRFERSSHSIILTLIFAVSYIVSGIITIITLGFWGINLPLTTASIHARYRHLRSENETN